MYQIQGKLIKINDTKQVSEKFAVREFVIEDSSGQYPQSIQLQTTQDRCSLLDSFKLGEDVMINFNIRGREWNSPSGEVKYFNSLEAWKIDSAGSPQAMAADIPPAAAIGSGEVNPDDLPF